MASIAIIFVGFPKDDLVPKFIWEGLLTNFKIVDGLSFVFAIKNSLMCYLSGIN